MIILSTCSALNRIETVRAQEEGKSHSLWRLVQASYDKGMFELGGMGIGRYGDPQRQEGQDQDPEPEWGRVRRLVWPGCGKGGREQGKHAAHESLSPTFSALVPMMRKISLSVSRWETQTDGLPPKWVGKGSPTVILNGHTCQGAQVHWLVLRRLSAPQVGLS